jgi:hypothetical protein
MARDRWHRREPPGTWRLTQEASVHLAGHIAAGRHSQRSAMGDGRPGRSGSSGQGMAVSKTGHACEPFPRGCTAWVIQLSPRLLRRANAKRTVERRILNRAEPRPSPGRQRRETGKRPNAGTCGRLPDRSSEPGLHRESTPSRHQAEVRRTRSVNLCSITRIDGGRRRQPAAVGVFVNYACAGTVFVDQRG